MVVIYYYSFVSLYQIYNFIFVLNLPEKILLRRSFAFDANYDRYLLWLITTLVKLLLDLKQLKAK